MLSLALEQVAYGGVLLLCLGCTTCGTADQEVRGIPSLLVVEVDRFHGSIGHVIERWLLLKQPGRPRLLLLAVDVPAVRFLAR